MKLLNDSVQVNLSIPRHVDDTFKKLGFDVEALYQRSLLDILRADLDVFADEVPVARGAREQLEQEVKHLDQNS